MHNVNLHFNHSKLHIKAELAKLSGTHVIMVSPTLAKSWMSFGGHNRPLSESHVNELAKRMDRGEWALNGQSLIFNSNGELTDGQHRIAAVIKSGTNVLFDVRFGIDPSVFDTIDDGKKRTASDIFAIEKIPNYSNVAATCRLIMGMNKGSTQSQFGNYNRPSNKEVLEWYFENNDVSEYVTLGLKWYEASGRLMSPSIFASFAYKMAEVDHNKAMKFMEHLAFGFDLSINSPIFKLRSKLAQAKVDNTKKMSNSYERALIIKAWNLFKAGKTVKILKYDTEREPFPLF